MTKVACSVDELRMLDTAVAFFLSSERCAPDLAFGVYGTHSVGAPRIANYALATEIALKLLAHQAGTLHDGHSLKRIFGALPGRVRERLCHREVRRQLPHLVGIYERNWANLEPDWDWAWYALQREDLTVRP